MAAEMKRSVSQLQGAAVELAFLDLPAMLQHLAEREADAQMDPAEHRRLQVEHKPLRDLIEAAMPLWHHARKSRTATAPATTTAEVPR